MSHHRQRRSQPVNRTSVQGRPAAVERLDGDEPVMLVYGAKVSPFAGAFRDLQRVLGVPRVDGGANLVRVGGRMADGDQHAAARHARRARARRPAALERDHRRGSAYRRRGGAADHRRRAPGARLGRITDGLRRPQRIPTKGEQLVKRHSVDHLAHKFYCRV